VIPLGGYGPIGGRGQTLGERFPTVWKGLGKLLGRYFGEPFGGQGGNAKKCGGHSSFLGPLWGGVAQKPLGCPVGGGNKPYLGRGQKRGGKDKQGGHRDLNTRGESP